MDVASVHKRAQNFGFGGTMSAEKVENNYSEHSYSGSKRMKAIDHEEEEMSEEAEDVRRYSNPRKQIHHSLQTSNMIDEVLKKKKDSRMNTPRIMKKEDENDYHERSDKKGNHGTYRTPAYAENPKKGVFNDYTPSPVKSALYEGRTRRSVRPFNHVPSDYEVEK